MRGAPALAILLAGAAWAGTNDRLFADGNYDAAVGAALARNDATGFADAARAVLADEASRDECCLSCLKRAEDFARRAVAGNPGLPDGQVYLAVALGLESRIEGTDAARRKGYAGEARHALEAALAADPKNAWALAGMGGWNVEVVRGGGPLLAYLLYGATIERGRRYFAEAFHAAPDNIVIRYQYALSLAGCDTGRFRGEIENSLRRAVKGRDDTLYGRLLQSRAGELLQLLKSGDAVAFAARVRRYEGYP